MSISEQEELLDDICNDVLGYGPLEPLLSRDDIADIMVNGSRNVYIEVATRAEADFKFVTYNGTPGVGASLLGRMSPPDEDNEGQMEVNSGDARWTEEGVSLGGFSLGSPREAERLQPRVVERHDQLRQGDGLRADRLRGRRRVRSEP